MGEPDRCTRLWYLWPLPAVRCQTLLRGICVMGLTPMRGVPWFVLGAYTYGLWGLANERVG